MEEENIDIESQQESVLENPQELSKKDRALNDLYDMFVEEGYTKSKDEFLILMQTNENAVNDAYDMFVEEGYNKTINDFVDLLEIPLQAAQKKNPVGTSTPVPGAMESDTSPNQDESGSLESSAQDITEQSGIDPSLLNQPETLNVGSNELFKFQDFTFQEEDTDDANLDYFNESLKQIDADLIASTEENVVPLMRYHFGDYGFTFEEGDWLGDGMRVTARNGQDIYINLDRLWSKKETAQKLINFLKDNKNESLRLQRLETGFKFNKKKVKDEEEVDVAIKDFQEQTDNQRDLIKDFLRMDAYYKENELDKMDPNKVIYVEGLNFYGKGMEEGSGKTFATTPLQLKLELGRISDLINRNTADLQVAGANLDQRMGEWYDMRADQGSWSAGLYNALLDGIGRMGSGQMDFAMSLMPTLLGKENLMLPQEQDLFIIEKAVENGDLKDIEGLESEDIAEVMNALRQYIKLPYNTRRETQLPNDITDQISTIKSVLSKEGRLDDYIDQVIDEAIRVTKYGVQRDYTNPFSQFAAQTDTDEGMIDFARGSTRESFGIDETPQEWTTETKQGFWGGAVLGLGESLPAMLGPSPVRVVNLVSQVADHTKQEMAENPEFANVSDAERNLFVAPLAITVGVLENIGFRNVLNQGGFVNKILLRAINKTGKDVTAKTFREVVQREVNSMLAKGVLILGAGGVAEFETGLAQEVADITFKEAYNAIKDKDMFQTPESFEDAMAQVIRAGGQEMVGGLIMSIPGAISNAAANQDFSKIDDVVFKTFLDIKNENTVKEGFTQKIKQAILDGSVDKTTGQKMISYYDQVVGVMNQIPENLSLSQQKKLLGNLMRQQELNDYITKYNTQLTKKQQQELSNLKKEAENIVNEDTSVNEKVEVTDQEARESLEQDNELNAQMEARGMPNSGQKIIDKAAIKERKNKLIKEKQDAIQESKTETVDVQESTQDSPEVGERDTPGRTTPESESQTEITEETQEEVDDLREVLGRPTPSQSQTGTQTQTQVETETAAPTEAQTETPQQTQVEPLTETEQAPTDVVEVTNESTNDVEIQNTKTGNRVKFKGRQVEQSNLFEVDTPENTGVNQETKSIISFPKLQELSKKAIKSVEKILPNTKIILHKSEDSYNAATNQNSQGSKGKGGTRGLFDPTTNTIHINAPFANARTVPHEIFHAILLNNLSDPEIIALTDRMVSSLRKTIKDPELIKELDDFVAKYKDKPELKNEEFVAEFIGILSENYNSMNKPSQNLVQRFLNRLANLLGIDQKQSPKNTQELLNTLAGKITEGQVIEESDIAFVQEGKTKTETKKESKVRDEEIVPGHFVMLYKDAFGIKVLGPGQPGTTKTLDKAVNKAMKESKTYQEALQKLNQNEEAGQEAVDQLFVDEKIEQQLQEEAERDAALQEQRDLENELAQLPNEMELFLFENVDKVHTKDYDRYGDPNYRKDFGIGLNRLLRKSGGQDIDVQAQELSEVFGTEITIQDIIDYLTDRASTPGKYTQKNAQRARDLGVSREQKFSPGENTQQKITQLAIQNGIQQNGFFRRDLFNPQALRKRLQSYGYGLKAAYKSYGDGALTGYYITQPSGRKWNLPKDRTRSQAMFDKSNDNVLDVINTARDNNFSRSAIREVLMKDYGLSAKQADAALNIELDNLYELPPSYGEIGLNSGIKLFRKVAAAANKLANKNLTEQEVLEKTLEFLEKQAEYQNATQTQKDAMYVGTQKALGLKPTKNVGTKIRQLKEALRQRKKGRSELQKIKSKLRNYMRQVLPVDIYNKSDVMNMVRKITNATEANIDRLITEVTDFATKRQVKFLDSAVNNILNGVYETVESGKKKGKKIALKTRLRLENIRDNLIVGPEATADQVIERNALLNKKYNELSQKVDLTTEERAQMLDLLAAMSINNSKLMEDTDVHKVESLQNAEDILSGILGVGRQDYKNQLEAAHKKYKNEFAEVFKAVTGKDIDIDSPEGFQQMKEAARQLSKEKNEKASRNIVVKTLSRIKDGLNSYFKSSESLMGLMEIIASAPGVMMGGAAKTLVYDKLNASTIVFKRRMLQNRKIVLDKVKELYGKKWRKEMSKNSTSKFTGVYTDPKKVEDARKKYEDNPTPQNKKNFEKIERQERINLSNNEIAYLWMQYQDPANIPSFANPENEMFGPDHARIMKELESKLPKEVIEFANWQINEYFPSLYSHYDATYQDIYRTNLPWNKYYAGRIYREGIVPDPLDLLGDKAVLNQQVGAASTKVRIKNNRPIQPTDMMDGLMTYLTDMEWFAAFGSEIRDINKLFNNPVMRKAIKDKHGDAVMRLIDHSIKNIAARGINTSRGNSLVNWFNNLFITSRLGLNPTIMIKQLTSIPTYANDIGPAAYMKYAFKNKAQFLSVWKEIMKNSVYMQDRMTTDMRRTIEAYNNNQVVKFMPNISTNYFVNAMMFFIKAGDIGAIMLGGMPNYSYYKAQFKKNNPNATEQQAIDYAIKKFENDTKNTQQSMDLQDKDYYQSSDAITRSLNMFLTTPKQYLRKEFSGLRNMYRGMRDKNLKQFSQGSRTFLMYHAIMPALFQFISLGLPGMLRPGTEEDEEDMLRSVILGNFNALFIAGDLISGIADAVQEKPYAGQMGGFAPYDALNEIAKLYERAQRTKDPVKKQATIDRMMYRLIEIGTAGKVPVSNIAKMIENLQEASKTSDNGELILRMLNYSNYFIERGKVVKKPSTKKKKDPSEDKGKKDIYTPIFPDSKSKKSNPNAIFGGKKNKENQIFKEGKKNPYAIFPE